ncbi:hypothetical protein OROGR_028165 [Orobanche gracilis]
MAEDVNLFHVEHHEGPLVITIREWRMPLPFSFPSGSFIKKYNNEVGCLESDKYEEMENKNKWWSESMLLLIPDLVQLDCDRESDFPREVDWKRIGGDVLAQNFLSEITTRSS